MAYKKIWKPEEIQFIKLHFSTMTQGAIAKSLKTSLNLVQRKCYELGLKHFALSCWTDEQIAFLVNNFKGIGDSELSHIFTMHWPREGGWSRHRIEKKRRAMGLIRTEEDLICIMKRNISSGKFSTDIALASIRAPIAQKRVRINKGFAVVVIKLKDGFVPYAHWLYEQVFGRIPSGYIVRFKDDDPFNVTVGNLYLMTRTMSALRATNSKTPIEIKELKKLIHKLKFNIYEKQNRRSEKPLV